MTEYIIKFKSKETLDWLKKISENLKTKARENPTRFADIGVVIHDLEQAVNNSEVEKTETISENKTRITKTAAFHHNLCPEHPTYSAQRAPSIDCEGHWKAYKKMNPNSYESARRKYERTKKK